MRGVWAVAVVMGLAVAAPAGGATTVTVATSGLTFTPKEVSVTAGDTVRWTSANAAAHTVHFESEGAALPKDVANDSLGSRTFPTPGTYAYYCDPHRSLGMVGTVVVSAAPAPPPGEPSPSPAPSPSPSPSPGPSPSPSPSPQPGGEAPPAAVVERVAVGRHVRGGRVRGKVTVTPAGTAFEVAVRARGRSAGSRRLTATGAEQTFSVKLTRRARTRLREAGKLRATIAVRAGEEVTRKRVTLRPLR